jgi:hypothetical protein
MHIQRIENCSDCTTANHLQTNTIICAVHKNKWTIMIMGQKEKKNWNYSNKSTQRPKWIKKKWRCVPQIQYKRPKARMASWRTGRASLLWRCRRIASIMRMIPSCSTISTSAPSEKWLWNDNMSNHPNKTKKRCETFSKRKRQTETEKTKYW